MKKVYVVTGGAGGIGLDAAKSFKNGKVVIVDVNENALASGKKELLDLGMDVETFKCDITDKAQTDKLASMAGEFGDVAGVIHTAGVSGTVPNTDIVMKVDLIGTENIIESFLPYMKEGSSMVLIASMMGHSVPANPAYDKFLVNPLAEDFLANITPFLQGNSDLAYNFAKRGVILLAEKWAKEFGAKGARINTVSPGVIETPMALKAAEEHPETMAHMRQVTPAGRNGKPADITNAIQFLCDNEKASFITGSDIRVDGGLIKTMLAAKAN